MYDRVTIGNMTITFPDFIKFEGGQSGLNGQTLTITNEIIYKNNPTFTKSLSIAKYSFGEKYGDGNKIKEENGDRILKIEEEKITIKTNGIVYGAQGSGSLSITPTVTLAEMAVSEVYGTIQPDIDVKPTEVELNNLPDFLQDDEIRLDITNPVFSFNANNPLNTDVEMDGVLTGYKDGKVTKIVKIGSGNGGASITLKPSGDKQQTISIVRDEQTVVEANATKVVVPNLNDIIETIPDHINVELKPAVKTEQYYTVNLGQDYTLNSAYDIDIPLSFGSNLKIVYEETLDNFDLDLEDVDIQKSRSFHKCRQHHSFGNGNQERQRKRTGCQRKRDKRHRRNRRGNHHGKQRRQDRSFKRAQCQLERNSGRRHQQAGRPEAEDNSCARTSHRCSVAKHTMDAA